MTRNAWICTHRDCDPPRRLFLRPGDPEPPECSEHGARHMVKQTNVPYVRPEPAALDGQPRERRRPVPHRPRRPRSK